MAQECVVVQQQYQETLEHMQRKKLQLHRDVTFVDTQVKVVEMAVFVIEVVQSQVKFVGQVTADQMAVCVPKVAGQEQVGVQQELHVDVVSQQTIGAIQDIVDIVG